MGTSLTKPMKTDYNAVCQGRRTTMVVNGKKIFFEYHPFEKRGGVNPMGGYFLKKVWREAFFATPCPVLGTPPFPFRGGLPP